MPTDPYTQIYQALVTALKADANFGALVNEANVIDHANATQQARLRYALAPGDLPMVVVTPSQSTAHYRANSSGNMFSQTFDVTYIAQSDKLHAVYFPLKWAIDQTIIRNMFNFGLSFVLNVRGESRSDSFREIIFSDNANTGLKAWTCDYQVTFDFEAENTSSLVTG